MAGGIDWFRWHHGSVTDPKFQLVARQAGASLPDVLAVWAYLLESASSAQERGNIGEIDCEAVDCMFGFPATETRTADILAAMSKRGILEGERITAWDKRQPKREREGDTSTDRVRIHRAMKHHETPNSTSDSQETPRGEKRREEKKEEKPPAAPWLTVPELVADGLSQNLSADWLAHRRSRKAKLTRLAWEGFKAEVSKAGWQLDDAIRKAIARNWTAFEAEWVKPAGPAFQAVAAVTVPSLAADKTAELLKADEEHRAEVARQRSLRQEKAA
ncbi:MAG: hypothetical protein Q7T97_02380 [Burkholderiaceae bacterium]|nr:hypothetical protein [Burkholderiaceae bacterium]